MNQLTEEKIIELEESLCEAMLNSDINLLDKLLSQNLIFTDHIGQVVKKEDDIKAHKSGIIKINKISTSERRINILSDTAIVSVLMDIEGEFENKAANGLFRFTRIWSCLSEEIIQVVAAHSSFVG